MRCTFLRSDIDCLISVKRVQNQRGVKTLGIGGGETRVPSPVPLHRRAHAVAVAEMNIVSHPDFVAVINDWSTRKRHEQAIHELDPPAVIFQQGSKTSTY